MSRRAFVTNVSTTQYRRHNPLQFLSGKQGPGAIKKKNKQNASTFTHKICLPHSFNSTFNCIFKIQHQQLHYTDLNDWTNWIWIRRDNTLILILMQLWVDSDRNRKAAYQERPTQRLWLTDSLTLIQISKLGWWLHGMQNRMLPWNDKRNLQEILGSMVLPNSAERRDAAPSTVKCCSTKCLGSPYQPSGPQALRKWSRIKCTKLGVSGCVTGGRLTHVKRSKRMQRRTEESSYEYEFQNL